MEPDVDVQVPDKQSGEQSVLDALSKVERRDQRRHLFPHDALTIEQHEGSSLFVKGDPSRGELRYYRFEDSALNQPGSSYTSIEALNEGEQLTVVNTTKSGVEVQVDDCLVALDLTEIIHPSE